MNCKPGDLAIITRSITGKVVGNVVSCIRILDRHEHSAKDKYGPMWLVDREFGWTRNGSDDRTQRQPWWPDMWLLPINPLDDQETVMPEALRTE